VRFSPGSSTRGADAVSVVGLPGRLARSTQARDSQRGGRQRRCSGAVRHDAMSSGGSSDCMRDWWCRRDSRRAYRGGEEKNLGSGFFRKRSSSAEGL
jgi:hypothetical protein